MSKKDIDYSWLTKAYHDEDFLNSPQARNIRILCEMMEPAHRLRVNRVYNTVVFFGSARSIPLSQARSNVNTLSKSNLKKAINVKKLKQAKIDLRLSKYYEEARILAKELTHWFNSKSNKQQHFYICSGGGPGMMEAANKGAKQAKGKSIGLNISLPFEQAPNIYQTKDISFEFHYFFIRKFWFFYLAKALVVFPGGYGTLDELFELLTIIQTQKTKKHMPVVLYGSDFWNDIINFDALLEWGTISKEDLKLFHMHDDIDSTMTFLKSHLTKYFFKKTNR